MIFTEEFAIKITEIIKQHNETLKLLNKRIDYLSDELTELRKKIND